MFLMNAGVVRAIRWLEKCARARDARFVLLLAAQARGLFTRASDSLLPVAHQPQPATDASPTTFQTRARAATLHACFPLHRACRRQIKGVVIAHVRSQCHLKVFKKILENFFFNFCFVFFCLCFAKSVFLVGFCLCPLFCRIRDVRGRFWFVVWLPLRVWFSSRRIYSGRCDPVTGAMSRRKQSNPKPLKSKCNNKCSTFVFVHAARRLW